MKVGHVGACSIADNFVHLEIFSAGKKNDIER